MKPLEKAFEWAKNHTFSNEERFYASGLQLKILDDACQMDFEDKLLFTAVYQGMKKQYDTIYSSDLDALIEEALLSESALKRSRPQITQERLLFVKQMDRPTMKGYKAKVRENLS